MNHLVADSVGGALRFARHEWRTVLIAAGCGALFSVVFAISEGAAPTLNPLVGILAMAVQAFIYAALTSAALRPGLQRFDVSDGVRLWAAMIIVGFFLFLIFLVLMVFGAMALLGGPMAHLLPQLEQASANPDVAAGQAAASALFARFYADNPAPIVAFLAFYAIIWLLVTSRIYLAAPATVDQKRILTLETWKWTSGATLRVAGARLMLLAPAYVLVWTLTYLVGRLLGIDPINVEDAQVRTPNYVVFAAIFSFLTTATYLALEAGLSSALYRALKPSDGALPKA